MKKILTALMVLIAVIGMIAMTACQEGPGARTTSTGEEGTPGTTPPDPTDPTPPENTDLPPAEPDMVSGVVAMKYFHESRHDERNAEDGNFSPYLVAEVCDEGILDVLELMEITFRQEIRGGSLWIDGPTWVESGGDLWMAGLDALPRIPTDATCAFGYQSRTSVSRLTANRTRPRGEAHPLPSRSYDGEL